MLTKGSTGPQNGPWNLEHEMTNYSCATWMNINVHTWMNIDQDHNFVNTPDDAWMNIDINNVHTSEAKSYVQVIPPVPSLFTLTKPS